ncbi:MAG: hypothetical protein SBU_000786 [Candidatus Syntrophoarchaeum butanivorans]|uniref:Uncharacterized protein n=1 Tax=Candidatus Syntropharchaeum butanivorans TaxID=1839936 RepID=A0A1F2P4Z4_9EURY|nr:MAG: hypothetical protein SBU_000786 [Candidatus Syntrophoarchaeum butanivorans]
MKDFQALIPIMAVNMLGAKLMLYLFIGAVSGSFLIIPRATSTSLPAEGSHHSETACC